MAQQEKDKVLLRLFDSKKIVTMDALKEALGTNVDMTVYRALKRLKYRTSYTYGGQYYALDRFIQFDDSGLWSVGDVRFSKFGTLAATLENFITNSNAGYFADELELMLQVSVRETLLRLVQKKHISRQRVDRSYLYCAKNSAIRRQQHAVREAELGKPVRGVLSPDKLSDEVRAAIVLFAALLNEQQLRIFAGVEALQFGLSSDSWIADLLGIHRQTVAKGRRELLDGEVDFEHVRKKGAGRPTVEKKHQKSSKRSKS